MSKISTEVLTLRLIDGDLNAEEIAVLKERLKRGATARKRFVQTIKMEVLLRGWGAELRATRLAAIPKSWSKLFTAQWSNN